MKIRVHWPRRIRISGAWLFFLLLYMFQPSALSIGIVSKFYNLLKWMLPLLIAGTYIYKGKRPSKWIGLFFFMELWILLVTVYNKNYTAYAIKNLISITATACIVDIYADRFVRFLNVLLLHCELCIYTNLFTLIIAPNGFISRENEAYGMSTEWFLGHTYIKGNAHPNGLDCSFLWNCGFCWSQYTIRIIQRMPLKT